jgi:protease-4
MRQFWFSVIGAMLGVVLGGVAMVLLAGMIVSAWLADLVRDEPTAHGQTDQAVVLEVDLRPARFDQPIGSLLPDTGPLSVIELVETLNRAVTDPEIGGVFVRTGSGVTPADAEEIRRVLLAVRAAGKPVIGHIQTLNDTSTSAYLAVSAADEVWMHPSGWFAATGLRAEQLFFGDALSRLGAEAQFLQLYEYKGAAEIFTRSEYSPANREAISAWLGSLYQTALLSIAEDRGMSAQDLAERVEAGPYLARQALEVGLVDQLGQIEDARARSLALAGQARIEPVAAYARRKHTARSGQIIALVSGQGPVVDGPQARGLISASMLASDTVTAAIDSAAADPDVRAILIRIDTGGGSATASDQIAAAILRARQAGKPVVVSMGSVAASGGYYIAAPADHIVANAGTLTGSIGVVSGKIAVGSALENAGITSDAVTVGGAFTGATSPTGTYTEDQRAAIEAWASAIYADFTALVAESRDLPLARVDDLARGRVWTGAQAVELGLIDEVGGFTDAIDAARRLARLSADEAVVLKPYPAQPQGLDRLRALMDSGVQTGETLSGLGAILARPEVQAVMRDVSAQDQPVTVEALAEAPR